MTPNSVKIGRKTVILSVIICVAVMFVTSFVYRMQHPNLFVQVQQHASNVGPGSGNTNSMGPALGMGQGMGEGMSKVKDYMAQLEKNPNDVKALVNLGNSFLMMRAWDRALEPLVKANELAPGNVGLLKAIGIAYFNKEDFAKASATYEAILKINPEDTLALFNQGVIYKYYLEKPEPARTYFERVLAIEKDDAEIIKMAKQELEK